MTEDEDGLDHHLRVLLRDGDSIVVGGRNAAYNLSLPDLRVLQVRK